MSRHKIFLQTENYSLKPSDFMFASFCDLDRPSCLVKWEETLPTLPWFRFFKNIFVQSWLNVKSIGICSSATRLNFPSVLAVSCPPWSPLRVSTEAVFRLQDWNCLHYQGWPHWLLDPLALLLTKPAVGIAMLSYCQAAYYVAVCSHSGETLPPIFLEVFGSTAIHLPQKSGFRTSSLHCCR